MAHGHGEQNASPVVVTSVSRARTYVTLAEHLPAIDLELFDPGSLTLIPIAHAGSH